MEEGLPKVPKLELAQLKFVLMQEQNTKTALIKPTNRASLKETILKEIEADSQHFLFEIKKDYFYFILKTWLLFTPSVVRILTGR